MAIELYDSEVELKRVKESEIGWHDEETIQVNRDTGEAVVIKTPRRDHPLEQNQRWVFDPQTDEWVLCGPQAKK